MQKVRPPLKERKWPAPVCDLLKACWDPEPANRPETASVAEEMMRIVAAGYKMGKPSLGSHEHRDNSLNSSLNKDKDREKGSGSPDSAGRDRPASQ